VKVSRRLTEGSSRAEPLLWRARQYDRIAQDFNRRPKTGKIYAGLNPVKLAL
jgi:hypothetical protein